MLQPFAALTFRPGLDLDAAVCPSPEPGPAGSEGPLVRRLMEPKPGDRRYQRARLDLDGWIADGTLVEAAGPGLYTYTIDRGRGPAVTGLVGLASPSAPLPHEQVDDDRVADRTEHLDATGLQVAPVLALADHPPFVPGDDPVAVARIGPATHRIARSATPPAPSTWIVLADGHHRAAAARRLGVPLLVMLVSATDPGLSVSAHPGEPGGGVEVERVVEAALSGSLLGPKSTWFEPKPCAGLVMVRAGRGG